MSQRGKRQPNRTDDGPIPAKRRKCRPPAAAEEEETTTMDAAAAAGAVWTPRPLNDLKISSIYNRSATEAPAELFRKDLISAMKLPDSEPLSHDEYWVITDQWKQEWERGVQVPVNPDSLPEPTVTVNSNAISRPQNEFKLPKSKYIRITKDEFFTPEEHFFSNTPTKSDKACSYDLDDCDIAWLQILNGERACMGLQPVTEDQLERVIEELEIRCWEKVQTIVKTEEGLGIEYDENVICDVCRSPDSEEGNEMVFCDSCNICVHQACYGITTIPSGSWLCRTCALSLRPECVLCPNKGGAMKCTRSGQKWAHVSCALWIPEVSIGCVERMEPITKISSIPQSRWALICVLCRERVGACIQCSVKTCKTAYHVTCAFKHGLEMRAIIEDENADDGVKLRSYCQKHSVTSKKDKSGSASEDEESRRKKRKDMTSEEKNQARAAKLQEIEAEFDKHVSIKDITQHMDVDSEGIQYIYNYWKLKRKAGFNKPLLPPKSEDVDILSRQQEQADLEKMKMFVQLRQDLERVRNLCYMVSRREKLSRSFFRMREQTFHKQAQVLNDVNCNLKVKEIAAIIEANHGPSIYDRLYSQPSIQDHSGDFDVVLARIAGIASPKPSPADEKNKTDLNGLVKCSDKKENPYKRLYFNGAGRRRSSLYGSMSSSSETDTRPKASRHRLADSSTEEEEKPTKRTPPGRKTSSKTAERKRTKKAISKSKVESSSEEEEKPSNKNLWHSPRSRTLRQMERELGEKASATDDSDELVLPIKATKNEPHKINAIYSDSDSELESKSPSNTPSDSQQHVLRTKASVKEFSAGVQHKADKSPQKNNTKLSKSGKKEKETKQDDGSMDDDFIKDKENVKSSRKKEYDPTDLIVPQRQAAKKATESIRCSQGRTKEQILFEQEPIKTPPSTEEPKTKMQQQQQQPHQQKQEQQKEQHKVKQHKSKEKAGKESKSGSGQDIYDFEKDVTDPQEILAYVPQRQAAKKAAAHIKSGMTKPAVSETDAKKDQTVESKTKKEQEVPKPKKEQESEKPKSPTKSIDTKVKSKSRETIASSSSSSSSSVDSSSSSSESEEEVEEKSKPVNKTWKKDKKASIEALFSSEVSDKSSDKTKKPSPEKKRGDWPFLQHSSSSSDSDSDPFTRKSRPKPPSSDEKTKPKSIVTEERKGSNSKSVGKKFKKAPDKKLKTSDGRPEPEFQPPIIARDESSRAKGRGRKHGPGEEDRLRNAESRPGDLPHAKSGDRSPSSKCSRTPQKDQHEARKRKSSDINASVRRDSQTPPRKERVKSNDVVPPAAKKADEKESLGSQLEREIIERKAERETSSKKTSKVSLDRLFEKRDKKVDKALHSRSPEKTVTKSSPPQKEIKKELSSKDAEKKSPVKLDIQQKEKQKPIESLSKVEDAAAPKVEEKSENEKAKKYKDTELNVIVPSTGKESVIKKDKESVIKKAEKVPEPDSSDMDDSSRRTSTESCEGDDEKSKKEKPMPKCKKKALGVLNDIAVAPHQDMEKEAELVVIEPVKEVKHNEETPVKVAAPAKPPEPSELAAPVLSPEHEQAGENKLAAQNSFTLMPQLEKALDLGNDFQVPEQEHLEAKKITSRSSSLSVPSYPQRSIFSPQQPSKDPPVSELFDFENDILAVDETVNDDGFSIARDSEEIMRAPPLTFSFSSEFLFKEDSKEDSARETHLLVEKLRQEYAKKSTTTSIQPETSSVQEDIVEEKPEDLPQAPPPQVVDVPVVEEVKDDKPPEVSIEPKPEDLPVNIECNIENKLPDPVPPPPEEQLEKAEVPPYIGNDPNGPYEYHPCSMQLEVPKVSIPGREKLDRSNSAQADERWVPPSMDFVPEQHHGLMPSHHYEAMPPAPSPYTDLRNRTKWAESEMIPARRSSSSSASSTSSSSHRDDPDLNKRDDLHLPPHTADLTSYQGLHPGMPPYITDAPPYHTYSEASPFVGSVALFPPSCAQMPYPSPGGLYPPYGPPFPAPHSLLPPVPKPPDDTPHMPLPCGAAFTSSQQNMALTAAMVSPPPSTPNLLPPEPSPVMQHTEPQSFVQPPEPVQQLPLPMSPVANHHQSSPVAPTPSPAPQTPQTPAPPPPPPPPPISLAEPPAPKSTNTTATGKKIPQKPTRTSARFISQQNKSPGKSPGKSPRQQETAGGKNATQNRVRETAGNKRVGRGMYNQPRGGRGRGRGRGRGQHVQHFVDSDFNTNTIHSKLVGTVYDLEFDDESPSESVENLRAMRERRRSTDIHDRKMDTPFLSRDSPPTAIANSKLRSSYSDLRPPSPLPDELLPPTSNATSDNRLEQFPDVVQPMLPGPVDMRTYSSSYEPTPSNNPTAYHNHLLGAFATAAAEQHVTDFVEDLEKELHSALQASKSESQQKFTSEEEAKPAEEPPVAPMLEATVSNNKVSLSDSRNQLKVKIKGPFLDANYAATSSVPSQPAIPTLDIVAASNIIPTATTAITSAASSSGTSNLRRMRKKELLRQYCSQDMNMDDPAAVAVTGQATIPAAAPPVNRNVITIPKAVASMTSIPTREDYKAVVDANMEKKRRKEKAFSSSLRHLDLPGEADDCPPERRRSVGSTGSNASQPDTMSTTPIKRRGRPPKTNVPASGPIMVLAPKLKIKIGNSIIGAPETDINLEEKSKLRVRPPKKRLQNVVMPSVEELKRESMKFRRMIMADFDEAEKKHSKGGTSKKRKLKQADSEHEVQIITADEKVSAPKLIIRIKSQPPPPPKLETPPPAKAPDNEVPPIAGAGASADSENSEVTSVRTSKVTPIRLKFARCQEGYMMKTSQEGNSATETAPPPESEGCDVR